MSDITLTVRVKQTDGIWIAKTPVYEIYGDGNTPGVAIENFIKELRELYSGDIFQAAGNRPVNIVRTITGVTAEVHLTVMPNRSLGDFGVGVAEPPAEEVMETPSTAPETPAGKLPPFTYGISLSRYTTEMLRNGRQTHVVMPSVPSKVTEDDIVMVYERQDAGGRKAYVGDFVAGKRSEFSRDDTEWAERLNIDEDAFADLFGTSLRRFALEVVDYSEYATPAAVPEGEKAPRGINWLSPAYMAKIEGCGDK